MISDSSSVDEGLDEGDHFDDFLAGGSNENDDANADNQGNAEQIDAPAVDWPLISSVEVPGDVQNENVILEKLGGAENLSKNVDEDQGIALDVGNFAG